MKASLQRGGCDEVEVSLSSHVTRESMRGSGLKLQQGRLGLILGKEIFSRRVVRHWPQRWGITVPGGFQELWKCSTEGRGSCAWWGWAGGWIWYLTGLFQP